MSEAGKSGGRGQTFAVLPSLFLVQIKSYRLEVTLTLGRFSLPAGTKTTASYRKGAKREQGRCWDATLDSLYITGGTLGA